MGRAFEARRAGKEKRWGEMSRLYPKLGKIITMAAKAGGSDPNSNTALKTAINNAKAQNMPKDNIEKAIKRAMLQITMRLVMRAKGLMAHSYGSSVLRITRLERWLMSKPLLIKVVVRSSIAAR